MQRYRQGLKFIFDLLVKYEKSKVSTTGVSEIGLNTLNFYCLRSKITPLFVSKTAIAMMSRATLKKAAINGIDFSSFEELIFKIIVKGKVLLNSRKSDPDNEDFEMEESGMPSHLSSPDFESPLKKNLTDEYSLDANGVTVFTVRRMMEFLELPSDKPEAEEKFR
jgi:hypothetical protein